MANQWRTDGRGPLVPLDVEHFTPAEIDVRLQTYFKFMFVRHPFERLVSGFLDRLQQRSRETVAQKALREKVRRRAQQQQDEDEGKVEVEEAEEEREEDGTEESDQKINNSTQSDVKITFQELVRYILEERLVAEKKNTFWSNLCSHRCAAASIVLQTWSKMIVQSTVARLWFQSFVILFRPVLCARKKS